MATPATTYPTPEIVYPERDGKPMAENTKQARWIMVLHQNLEALYADDPNVFIAADNLIYPVEGRPEIRRAPDVYVVFGRPKGDRGSYQYWREANVPVTVAFEILSPGTDPFEMADKLEFYNEHGIEEYYVYDPDTNRLMIYLRKQVLLVRQYPVHNFVSPRVGICFDLSGEELVVRYPDGRPFLRLFEQMQITEAERQRAENEHQRAESDRKRAEQAEQLLVAANQRRLQRIAEMSRMVRSGQITAEELAELDRLVNAE